MAQLQVACPATYRRAVERLEGDDEAVISLQVLARATWVLGDGRELARALTYNSRLQDIHLTRCMLGDAGAASFARVLGSQISGLRTVSLVHNDIGDAGAAALAGALVANAGALTHLDLSHNRIKDAGGRALAATDRTFVCLHWHAETNVRAQRVVVLSHNQLSAPALAAIAQQSQAGMAPEQTTSALRDRLENAREERSSRQHRDLRQAWSIAPLGPPPRRRPSGGQQGSLDQSQCLPDPNQHTFKPAPQAGPNSTPFLNVGKSAPRPVPKGAQERAAELEARSCQCVEAAAGRAEANKALRPQAIANETHGRRANRLRQMYSDEMAWCGEPAGSGQADGALPHERVSARTHAKFIRMADHVQSGHYRATLR